jgi:hypothetical protein
MAIVGGAQSLAAGDYIVGFWYNGTTSPTWARVSAASTALINIGVSTPNLLCGFADTGLTTTAPAPMAAQTGAGGYWWVALS